MNTIPFSRAKIGVMLNCLIWLMGSTSALASYEYQVLQSLGKPEGTPRGQLVQGSDGYFYGTTVYGGNQGAGTVFKISATGNFTMLHEFDGAEGGKNPQAGLIQASDGTFYDTTVNGGGIVFKARNRKSRSAAKSISTAAPASMPTTVLRR